MTIFPTTLERSIHILPDASGDREDGKTKIEEEEERKTQAEQDLIEEMTQNPAAQALQEVPRTISLG